MKFFRAQRVGSLIRDRLGLIIQKEIEFDKGLITITSVLVSKKLDRAKVSVSVYPSRESEAAFNILSEKVGELQRLLTEDLNIKPMPRIIFELDQGPEKAARIEKELLRDNIKE